jgi:hypothetical protein
MIADALATLRAERDRAAAARDIAQTVYAGLSVPGERLQTLIGEHRAKTAALAAAANDDQYGEQLAELATLEREIAELRTHVKTSEFHDARRALQAANARLDDIGQQIEAEVWAAVPRATARWCAEFETAAAALGRVLARLDGLANYAHRQAHQQREGRDPSQHPAYRTWEVLRHMISALTASIGGHATRDFASGPALVAGVADGTAPLGDISAWLPPSQALPDGSAHIQRPGPDDVQPEPAEPVGMANPALTPSPAPWLERQPP